MKSQHQGNQSYTGRDLAAHRLLMGVARTALAKEMHVHHYQLASMEHTPATIHNDMLERWRAALSRAAKKTLNDLGRQGFSFEALPAPMREVFALYVRAETESEPR